MKQLCNLKQARLQADRRSSIVISGLKRIPANSWWCKVWLPIDFEAIWVLQKCDSDERSRLSDTPMCTARVTVRCVKELSREQTLACQRRHAFLAFIFYFNAYEFQAFRWGVWMCAWQQKRQKLNSIASTSCAGAWTHMQIIPLAFPCCIPPRHVLFWGVVTSVSVWAPSLSSWSSSF